MMMKKHQTQQSTGLVTALLALVLWVAACGGGPGTSPAPVVAPVYVVAFDDKSGSAKAGRMTPLREDDLRAVADMLRVTGGELAFGIIGEASDRPLLRVSIPAPPPAPALPNHANPFQRREQEEAYRKQLPKYQAQQQAWENEVNQRLARFFAAARPRLQAPATEQATGIHEALERAALLLNEPAAQGAQRFVLLNSDGIATTRHTPATLPANVRLLLCNGTGSVGDLAVYQSAVQRFEAVPAALDFLRETVTPRPEKVAGNR